MTPFDQAIEYLHETLTRQPQLARGASWEVVGRLIPEGRVAAPAKIAPVPPASKPQAPSVSAPAFKSVGREMSEPAVPTPTRPTGGVRLADQVRAALQKKERPAAPLPEPAPVVRRPVELEEPFPVSGRVESSFQEEDPFRSGAPLVSLPSQEERMEQLRLRTTAALIREPLARHRTQFVFGAGSAEAEVMFIGESPGADEEFAGEPFVGPAGQLLTKIIVAMGLKREGVYLADLVKWRLEKSPDGIGSRPPNPREMAACLPCVIEQIGIIQPKCIVALGETVMQGLTECAAPEGGWRGRWHDFRGVPLMVTDHPNTLLRSQSLGDKRRLWEEMLLVLEHLDRPITSRQRAYFLPK